MWETLLNWVSWWVDFVANLLALGLAIYTAREKLLLFLSAQAILVAVLIFAAKDKTLECDGDFPDVLPGESSIIYSKDQSAVRYA